jgi:hypothetical protein
MFSWSRGGLASVLAFFYIVYQHGPIGSILYLVVPIVSAGLLFVSLRLNPTLWGRAWIAKQSFDQSLRPHDPINHIEGSRGQLLVLNVPSFKPFKPQSEPA